MPKRLAIFIDDYACCAQTSSASAQGTPTIALSSQVLMRAEGDRRSEIIVCDLNQEPGDLQKRLGADLNSKYTCVGLAEALEPTAEEHLLERYLSALMASCLRLVDASGRAEEVVVAIPLRSKERRQRTRPEEQAPMVALDDARQAQAALDAIAPLFEGRKFTLADAHELARQKADGHFEAHLDAGNHAAVIGLWRERFSIMNLMPGGKQDGGCQFQIMTTPVTVASDMALGMPITKSLAPTGDTRLDHHDERLHLVAPQMSLGASALYGDLEAQLGQAFHNRYPTALALRQEALEVNQVVRVASYAVIGSLALNPAIFGGMKGNDQNQALTLTLGNMEPAACLDNHPVMSVLDQALRMNIAPAGPAGAATTPRVASIGGQSTENRAAGILPVKIAGGDATFAVSTTSGKHPVIEIMTLPSDRGLEAMVEYGHLEDGSIKLKACMDRRVLPLDNAGGKDAQAEVGLDLLEDGSYRLTLDQAHHDASILRRDLRRLVTQGLRLHGSYGRENEEAS